MKFVFAAYGFTIFGISALLLFCASTFIKIKTKLHNLEKNETQKRENQETKTTDF